MYTLKLNLYFFQSFELLHEAGKTIADVYEQADFKSETSGMKAMLKVIREELNMEVGRAYAKLKKILRALEIISHHKKKILRGPYVIPKPT